MVALGQLWHPSVGRDYYDRRLLEGKIRREALRALERQLTNVIGRHLFADVDAQELAAAAA